MHINYYGPTKVSLLIYIFITKSILSNEWVFINLIYQYNCKFVNIRVIQIIFFKFIVTLLQKYAFWCKNL